MSKEDQDQQLVTVQLKLPHTHAGQDYLPGDTITVSADLAAWLAARGVIETIQEDK